MWGFPASEEIHLAGSRPGTLCSLPVVLCRFCINYRHAKVDDTKGINHIAFDVFCFGHLFIFELKILLLDCQTHENIHNDEIKRNEEVGRKKNMGLHKNR